MTIEERAAKLLEDVLEKFYSREKWDNRSLMAMIDEEMLDYNDDIARELESIIGSTLAKSFTKSIPTVIPTPVQLSNMLYRNGDKVAAETYQVLKAAHKAKITSKELAMKLYDGYNFKDEAVLDVIEKLPKYVQRYIDKPSTRAKFLTQINKLKTKPYNISMQLLDKAVQEGSEKAIDKALSVVLEEKSRYYGERIAQTEVQRAATLADANDMIGDEDIEFVKHRMSSRHSIYDICDIFNTADSGYGSGIYKKEDMIALPHHPHCMCSYLPHYHNPKYKKVKDPLRAEIESKSLSKQVEALGSKEKVRQFKQGKSPIAIWNENRPEKYHVQPVKDVLERVRRLNSPPPLTHPQSRS